MRIATLERNAIVAEAESGAWNMIAPAAPAWPDQLERAKRFLKRIDIAPEDLVKHPDRPEYEDFLWAFFQNCWHLKDWIKNDDSVPQAIRDTIEDCIEGRAKNNPPNNPAIRICADLANRSKHLKLTRNIREDAKIPGQTIRAEVGGPNPGLWAQYDIQLQDGTKREALGLAQAAIAEWEHLIANWGLKTN